MEKLKSPDLVVKFQNFFGVSYRKGETDPVIANPFWYYLFKFGTALGDESFYAFFFSCWFWNVDGAVGRRVVLVWALSMYIGQSLKDIIKWPRPESPPVARLEQKWADEYGFPSTHAVVGFGVPFAIIIFTATRYQYALPLGVIIATIWCLLVCCSRIYLGMHSVLDILGGLALVVLLFPVIIPLVDFLDPILLKSQHGAILLLVGGLILAICSPSGDRWTSARGDTVVILGSVVGLNTGAWLNYQTGVIREPEIDPPYPIIWPTAAMVCFSVVRLIIGLLIVFATRMSVKSVAFKSLNSLIYSTYIPLENKKVKLELSSKFVVYVAIGFSIVYISPAIFRFLLLERPTFHTEV